MGYTMALPLMPIKKLRGDSILVVTGVVSPVKKVNVSIIMDINPIKAGNIYPKFVRVRAPLVVGVDSTR